MVDKEKQLSLPVFVLIINYRKNVNGLPIVCGIHHLDLVSVVIYGNQLIYWAVFIVLENPHIYVTRERFQSSI